MANRTLAYLSMLFAWALNRNIIKATVSGLGHR
jgi:hypothetical protein